MDPLTITLAYTFLIDMAVLYVSANLYGVWILHRLHKPRKKKTKIISDANTKGKTDYFIDLSSIPEYKPVNQYGERKELSGVCY